MKLYQGAEVKKIKVTSKAEKNNPSSFTEAVLSEQDIWVMGQHAWLKQNPPVVQRRGRFCDAQ